MQLFELTVDWDCVIIAGHRVERPRAVPVGTWLDFWEGVNWNHRKVRHLPRLVDPEDGYAGPDW